MLPALLVAKSSQTTTIWLKAMTSSRLLKNDLTRSASSSKAMLGTAVRHQFDERSRKTAQSLSKRSGQEFFSGLLGLPD